MAKEKLYDDENFEIDEDGVRVLDDDGNPILKVDEKGGKEGDKETPEEKITRLEKEKVDITKERDGIKDDLIETRSRRREAEDALKTRRDIPRMSKEEMEEWLDTPMTRREFEKRKEEILDEVDAIGRKSAQKSSMAVARQQFEDFDEVNALADELLKDPKNAHLKIALDYAEDYAEAKYLLGKTHPKYLDKVRQEAVGGTVKKIKKANEKLSPGAGMGGAGTGAGTDDDELTLEEYDKLSKAQQDALPQSTKERLLGGID